MNRTEVQFYYQNEQELIHFDEIAKETNKAHQLIHHYIDYSQLITDRHRGRSTFPLFCSTLGARRLVRENRLNVASVEFCDDNGSIQRIRICRYHYSLQIRSRIESSLPSSIQGVTLFEDQAGFGLIKTLNILANTEQFAHAPTECSKVR